MRFLIAGLFLVLSAGATVAEDWPAPRLLHFKPDWDAVNAALPIMQPPSRTGDANRLADVTKVASEIFPAVAESPVPVLLPFSNADYASERAVDMAGSPDSYLSGFQATKFFLAGPTGYDASFSLHPREVPELSDIGFADPVVVQISAFNTLYDLPEPKGAVIQPAREIEKEFPGIRRQILESTLRYSFERFGIPYVVSIQCYDGGPQRRHRLACRNAERVVHRFLRALRLVGGNPPAAVTASSPPAVARPEAQSDAFRFHPAGKLVAGTAMRAQAGDTDKTVYARIRFPAAIAPATVSSQKFGRRRASKTQPATEPSNENAGSVWRDNFCERRDFYVGQCPSGRGHQGQDIRGASCDQKNKAGCRPHNDDVVAARDGMILREAWNDSFFLVTNAAGERLRFRHLHMHPRKLDDDDIFSGHRVKEGDRLGTISNYSRRPGLTSTHLHFEIQVPTRDGWVRVNPYMTLVASYEHLIRARGTEIEEPLPEPEAAVETGPGEIAAPVVAATAATVVKVKARGKVKSRAKAKTKPKGKIKGKARGKKRR